MIINHRTAWLPAVLLIIGVFSLAAPPAQAGALPPCPAGPAVIFSDCLQESDTTGNLEIDAGEVVTFSAGSLAAPLIIGHTLNGQGAISKGSIATAGNGGIFHQTADIGNSSPLTDMDLNAGDIWYLSNNANIILDPLATIDLDSSILGIGPDSALSLISAGIRGSDNSDILDFLSGGESLGTTGTIGYASVTVNLRGGDDRFIYYQSVAVNNIAAGAIQMGAGNDVMGLLGGSVGSVFNGNFIGGDGNDILAFFSGSSAIFGSSASIFNFGNGDDTLDFDSYDGTANGTVIADLFFLGTGNDTIELVENATIEVGTQFDAGSGDDLIRFESSGYLAALGVNLTMGDGNDILRFDSVAFSSGVSGLNLGGGSLDMGNGDDEIIFTSDTIGLFTDGTVSLGAGNDRIAFFSSFGTLTFDSSLNFVNIDGGADTDIIAFGSSANVIFGSATGAAGIANVETLDFGSGTLRYVGTIDSAATLINFTSAEFWEAGTAIAATLNGDGDDTTLLFASGAAFSGTANLGAENDAVTFNTGALLAAGGTINLQSGNDMFSAGGGTTIAGTVDGGGDGNDALTFLSGLTTVSGDILGFASGQLQAGATVHIRDNGSVRTALSGTGTVRFGSGGSAADTYDLSGTLDGVTLEVAGDTLDTNGFALGQTTALGGLSIADGASLFMNDSIDAGGGVLSVDGTLRLAPGTRLTANGYDNTAGGDFVFQLDYDGMNTNAGFIDFGAGAVTFNSSDSFSFVLAPGTNPLVSDIILIASAGGAISVPANTSGSTILYDFILGNAGANELQLEIQSTNTIAGLTGGDENNETLATVLLEDLLNSTDSGINDLQAALFGAADEAAFNTILEETRPIVHGGEVAGIRTMNRQTFGLINQRLALLRNDTSGQTGINTGNLAEELEVWWQFYGVAANQDARDNVSGFESATFGLATGVDKELFDDAFFGLSFSWGDTTIDSDGAGDSDINVDSYQLSLYGDYDFGRAYANMMASYTYNDISTAKESVAGRRTGQYHANHFALRGELGYTFMAGKTRLIPKLIGQYHYFSPESYTEDGPGAQIITGDSLKIFEVGGGLDLQWLLGNDDHGYFVPKMSLGYRYDLADEPVLATTQFAAGGPVFEIEGFDPAEQTFDLGLGLTYFSRESWELLFNYDFEYKADYMSHAGMVRAAYKFVP